MTPRVSQDFPEEEPIPEKHWMYKFAKRFWYHDFGAYQELDKQRQADLRSQKSNA